MKKRSFYPATLCYIGMIVLLNTIFSYVPNLSFGQATFSSADFLVGLIYVTRDFAQREIQHRVIFAMLIGCALSYIFAEKEAALASVAAFIVGESIDWAIFTLTKKPLSQRILWSALVSAPADSVVNLYFLHQLNTIGVSIMICMKWLGVTILWYIWRNSRKKQKNICF